MITVYIVTNPEFGWDCVVGVFDASKVTREKLETRFTALDGYLIFEYVALTEADLE